MINYIWPILIVIAANTLYNITTKSTPRNADSFASLTVTYSVAAVVSFIIFLITSKAKNITTEFGKLNWTSIVLGFAIIALEFGYINVYRTGWKVSTGSLVANIGLACVLFVVGIVFYKENISIRQIVGMLICIVGLILISK